MQTVIIHLQRVSYFRPVIAVEAVIEIRLVRRVFVIAVDPQIHFVFRYFDPFRFKFLFNVVVIVIPNRYDIFFPSSILRRHNRIFREGGKPRNIALFHFRNVELYICAAFRSEGSLRKGVSRIGNSAADIARSQPKIAFPLGERPEAVVGIVVPLPFQREVRAVIIALARFLGRVGKAVIGSHYL